MLNLEHLIRQARGQAPVDLLIRNVQVINVLANEVHIEHVAVANGLVVGFGEYEARTVVEGTGRWLCPGLVEGHIHIESTLLAPDQFVAAVAPHGTAAVICDPHEIANVSGRAGVEALLAATADLPVAVFCMAPSCVPASHLETAGAHLTAEDIQALWATYPHRVLGLAEVMNYPGLLAGDDQIWAKLRVAGNRPIDGHAPLLGGKDLNAYILAGPGSDHEITSLAEAQEKLRKGMHIMIREGSHEHNLDALLPLLRDYTGPHVSLVSDDCHPTDLHRRGHLNYLVQRAIAGGVPPLRAIQATSINTARYFGLKRYGAIAPGCHASFILLSDIEKFQIDEVYLKGQRLDSHRLGLPAGIAFTNSIQRAPVEANHFSVPAPVPVPEPADPPVFRRIRVIGIQPGQIITEARELFPKQIDHQIVADPARDLAKLAVLERHHHSGQIGLGFVQGLKLPRGAIASSVAHDSHHLIVAGMNDPDMALAVNCLRDTGGGLVVVDQNTVRACLSLPLGGLMSDRPLAEVVRSLDDLNEACRQLGAPAQPFMILAFLALPVIPHLKLTDLGLVDVNRFEKVGLWV